MSGLGFSFFRNERVLSEEWFEFLDQYINDVLEVDCEVTSDLDSEFKKQPGLIAFWNFVLAELYSLKEKTELESLRVEGELITKYASKYSGLNLTYRIMDLISVTDEKYRTLKAVERRLSKMIKKVEGILSALDHKRSSLNYFARADFPAKQSI